MTILLTATEHHLEQLSCCALNTTTREIARRGIVISWADADLLGEMVIDWMRRRLSLRIGSDDRGIVCIPEVR